MLPSMIVVFALVSFTWAENPAIQVILSNRGLQYGKHVGAGWIQDKLELFTFPDISGKFDISIFGSVDYTLTGVTITKCDLPEPSVEFYQDTTGFKTSISGLSVALTGKWSTHYGIIHDKGSFDMAIFNVDMTSVVKLGRDADGHLSVASVSCEAHVGDVNIAFHGGASWMIEPFMKHFEGRVRGEIQDEICPKVEESLVELEDHLRAIKVSFDLNQYITLEVPLTGLPVINASSLNLGLKGEFYSTKTHAEPPFEARRFTVPEKPGYMFSMGLSDFTLNSALYAYYSGGLLQILINDSMIPPGIPMHLNTSFMGPFIPQLPKMFPGLLMTLQVYARDYPMFSLQPGVYSLDFPSAVKAFAIQPNGTQTPLFKLNVDPKFSGKVWITDEKLKGSMALNNLSLTLESSEVGTFSIDALEKVAQMGAKIAMAKLNEKLGKGVVLPRMLQAQLVNTVLQVEKGFIAAFSNAQVLPTDRDFD